MKFLIGMVVLSTSHSGTQMFRLGPELQALGNDRDQAVRQLRGDVALNFRRERR